MDTRRKIGLLSLIVSGALLLTPASPAQSTSNAQGGASSDVQGVDSGNYNIQQSVEFGYRWTGINGNINTYDTFVNLGSGIRLFDYTLDMRSLNHQGIFFDDLSLSGFGYGGDPNDVTRLHIDKNKWYDFHLLFRRDKNFWDYGLWANPLNPAAPNPAGSPTTGCIVSPPTSANPGLPGYCSSPAIAEVNSPHAQDLVRRMQDYDLTLFPQSRVRLRLGYSHDRDEGAGFFTTDGLTITDSPENYEYTTDAYRVGVDFRILPRTTISYDQFINFFKQDNVVLETPAATPQSYGYQAPNGTPVDLGIAWETQTPAEVMPCAAPIAPPPATVPPTVNPICDGYVSFSQVGRPRNYMPTERLRFQSNYFQSFEMTGSFGYSTSDNKIPDFNESQIGWLTRGGTPGNTTAGPAEATRVSVDGDWSGVYAVTDKFRIEDFFRYDDWRIPGIWNSVLGSLFTVPGATGLGSPIGQFVPANCDLANSYSGPTCPNHTATSAADLADAYNWNFLKQDLKSNTFRLDYDFSRRFSADIGYLYTHREIYSSSLSYTTGDIYYPGGATAATAPPYYLAARGNCALVAGALPTTCMLNPDGDGSIIYTAPANTTPATVDTVDIGENSLLLGFRARPIDTLRIVGDFSFGYNDASYTRIDPRQVQSYKLHATYTPKPWASLDGAVEIHENRDNIFAPSVSIGGVPTGGGPVNNLEHDRMYSFTTTLMPNPRLAISFGYNYWDMYTQAEICFNYSITYTNPAPPPPATLPVSTSPPGVATTPCPITGASVAAAGLGALSTYASNDHFAHAEVMWKPAKRVTAALGYSGSFVRGTTIFLNPLAPSGTLDYNYQMPYGSVTIDLSKGFSYKMAWNYYGFNEAGNTSPFGLADIPLQDFNGNNATFSFRYTF